jgi:hypothetical protein
MKQITPGTALPATFAEAPSIMPNITRTSWNEFSHSTVRDASPGNGTPATAVLLSSLQRSNIQFFLRSIAKNPRPK